MGFERREFWSEVSCYDTLQETLTLGNIFRPVKIMLISSNPFSKTTNLTECLKRKDSSEFPLVGRLNFLQKWLRPSQF